MLHAQTSRDEAWREDISVFKNNLAARHINLFAKMERDDFFKSIEALENSSGEKADYEIAVEIMRILALAGDSHTNIMPWEKRIFRQYPLGLTVLKDGIFVTAAHDERLLKARLTGIGFLKTGEILRKITALIPHENEARVKAVAARLLQTPEVLKALGVIENMDEAEFSFEKDGEIFSRQLAPYAGDKRGFKTVAQALGDGLPAYRQNDAVPYWFGYFADSRTIYVQYNACVEMPEQSFKDFSDEVFAFAEEYGAEKFILDIRNNAGGDSRIMHPMAAALKKNRVFNRRGNFFVIIGASTFSSAVLNADLLKKNTQAIFVGEPTGGAPNHYGEVRHFSLPHSELRVSYSTRFLKTSDTDEVSFMPDIIAQNTSREYFGGQDAALEAILRYQISFGF